MLYYTQIEVWLVLGGLMNYDIKWEKSPAFDE
jgi:hypothetical protein